MRNKNNNGSASTTLVSGFLSLFLIGIIVFVLIGIVEVLDYNAGVPALVFEIINMLCVGVMFGLGSVIRKATGTATFAGVATVTGLYTVIQLVFTLLAVKDMGPMWFTLVSLIILFVYCLIVLPLCLNGAKHKND